MSFSAVKATSIGSHHVKSLRPCQDYSYASSTRLYAMVITADGHGSAEYFRSSVGSKLAVQALKTTFLEYFMNANSLFVQDPLFRAFRLKLLSRWNELVHQHLITYPWNDSELKDFSSKQQQSLNQSPYRAYGTTLNGSIITADWTLSLQIGDGVVMMKDVDGAVQSVFPREEELVGSTTHSLCEDDAFDHLRTKLIRRPIQWILHGTDGLVNPYQTYSLFDLKVTVDFVRFIQPLSIRRKSNEVRRLIRTLGLEQGTGDDVSMAIAFVQLPHYPFSLHLK